MHKTKNAITTIGSVTLDILFYTKNGRVIENPGDPTCPEYLAFERSAKIKGDRIFFMPGGGAANTAVTFARLGLKPALIGAIGADTIGRQCIEFLRAEGIDTSRIQKVERFPTGTSFIVNVGKMNDHVLFIYRGAAQALSCSRQALAAAKTPWMYLSSLSGEWSKNLSEIASYIEKGADRKLAWNPGSEQISSNSPTVRKLMKRTAVFVVNEDEAIELLLRSGRTVPRSSPAVLAKKLHSFGQSMTLVTSGHKGAHLYDGRTMHFQPAKVGKTLNKTGAGDSFASGFVAGLILFKSIQKALTLAMYNSSSVVTHYGAQTGILRKRDLTKIKI
ncbi:MAG: carbohydrate kinase family protein [Patescibacteria group bacterium]